MKLISSIASSQALPTGFAVADKFSFFLDTHTSRKGSRYVVYCANFTRREVHMEKQFWDREGNPKREVSISRKFGWTLVAAYIQVGTVECLVLQW